jgi:hypothetical protein
VVFFEGKIMAVLPKKSSPALRRRLPFPSFGIDINFCRNPQCDLFAEPPDPYDERGKSSGKVKSNQPRGRVIGSGDEKYLQVRSMRSVVNH